MKRRFYALNIGNKLRSLCRHTESEGIILRLWDEVHAYPPELNQRINSLQDPEVSDRVADWNRKQGAAVRKIQMSSGELLLIRPLNPPDDRTLAYLARQLEEDLESFRTDRAGTFPERAVRASAPLHGGATGRPCSPCYTGRPCANGPGGPAKGSGGSHKERR